MICSFLICHIVFALILNSTSSDSQSNGNCKCSSSKCTGACDSISNGQYCVYDLFCQVLNYLKL